MRNLIYPFMVLALAAGGCAGTPTAGEPDWISGASSRYPTDQYLLGRGQGEQSAVARDRARADLAKIFQVQITEQSEDIVRYTRSGGAAADTTLESAISRQLATRTEQTLSHIEIAELWRDPASRQYHALAVMDRLKAGQALREDIGQLDSLTAAAIAAARGQSELLAQLAHADRALQAQLQRRALQRQLQVIDPTGMGVGARHDLGKLIQDREQLLQRLTLQTRVSGDEPEGLQAIVDGAVARAGFSARRDQAAYRLDARLDLQPFTDKRWHWYTGTLEITLWQLPAEENRGSHRWDIKQAATQPALAKKRVLDALDRTLKAELRDVIVGFGEAR